MKRAWFKYLMISICFFSVLGKTGISLNSIFHIVKSADTECTSNNCNDDENSPERSETKETVLKEFWDIQQQVLITVPFKTVKAVRFANEPGSNHLAWVPPVPTPPPNF